MDDEALVARARGGDLDAAGELLELHQDGAYTASLRLLGDPSDAEDIAQEALVRAYTRIAELREGANFGAWLRRIAVNLSLNALRRRGLLQFESLDQPVDPDGRSREPVDEHEPNPEDAVVNRAALADVEALVRKLPAEQRVAVVLRDMYGFDVAEIAQLQRCGLSAAKMRISRGREHLRRLIVTGPSDAVTEGVHAR